MKRGFTLIELMIVTAIASVAAAMVGMFYLEVRVSAARSEAELLMTRRAALAVDWIRRDLQNANASVKWAVTERGLTRTSSSASVVVAPRATELAQTAVDGGYQIRLVQERTLLVGRKIRRERTAFIGRRQ